MPLHALMDISEEENSHAAEVSHESAHGRSMTLSMRQLHVSPSDIEKPVIPSSDEPLGNS